MWKIKITLKILLTTLGKTTLGLLNSRMRREVEEWLVKEIILECFPNLETDGSTDLRGSKMCQSQLVEIQPQNIW